MGGAILVRQPRGQRHGTDMDGARRGRRRAIRQLHRRIVRHEDEIRLPPADQLQIDFRQKLRVEKTAMQRALRGIDAIARAERIERILRVRMLLARQHQRVDHPLGSDRRLLPGTRVLNSILVFDEEAKVDAVYDKIKLVPFGEYVPLESALSHIGIEKLTHGRGAFGEGVTPRPLMTIPGLPPALGLVCYEALFGGEVVQGAARPGVLLNVTNDGWFGQSTGPYQHFHQSRIRAVEEGVPLIRAANNGISAVVDPYGRALQTLGLDVRGIIDSGLPQALTPPVYARAGDWMLALVLAAFSMMAAISAKLRR